MTAMSTEQLLQAALELAGWQEAPDCAVYQRGTRISHVLLTLDLDAGMLFMARQLGYHGVIAHQIGGFADPTPVYLQHELQLIAAGVPEGEAAAALRPGRERLELERQRANFAQLPEAARLLDQPLLTIRSPLDELGRRAMQEAIVSGLDTLVAPTVGDVRDSLLELASFAAAPVPMLAPLHGWDAPAGKVVVAHGAYAPPDYHITRAFLTHGVGTLCVADFIQDDLQRLRDEGVPGNILVMGRVAALSAGLLPYARHLRGQGIEVTTLGVVGEP
jgi:hypothetical protein